MIRNTRNYWCEHCPEDEEIGGIPIEEGTGFVSLRALGEHIEEQHPAELDEDSVEAAVLNTLQEAEEFIERTINPAIENAKAEKHDSRPLGVDWNKAVDKTVQRYEVKRSTLRQHIREERNALNREYFEELAEKYADHWASVNVERVGEMTAGLCSARAMAHEATEELGYDVNHWMCFWYLQAALPENHPEHDAERTRVQGRA